MGRSKSIIGRLGVVGLLLIASACSQRTAPVDLPVANPQPRAAPAPQQIVRVPQQQIVRRPVAPPAQIRPRPTEPFPQIGSNPPRAIQPSTPQLRVTRPPFPRVDPRSSQAGLSDSPYQAPNADTSPKIVESALEPPVPPAAEPAVPRRPVNYTAPPPTASDDYASLIGDRSPPQGGDGRPPISGPRSAQQGPDASEPPAAAPNSQSSGPAAAPAAGGKALVALLVPDSDRRGSVRALAAGLARAASLAATDIGEPRLELRKYDTGGDPRKAAEAAQNAIADGARLIIGPLFSGSAAAVRSVAQRSNVNVIAFTTDQSVLGDGLYSIGFLPETDVNRIVSYAARNGQRDIALIIPDSRFGGVIAGAATRAAQSSGAKIVKIQPFKEDFRSLDTAATQFSTYYKSAPNVDAVIMAANGKSLQGLASFLAFRDVLPTEVKYLGLGLWDDEETFREGTLRGAWFPGVDPILKNDFAYRYGQAYSGEPPEIALLGYDAVAVAAALIRSGGFSQQALLAPSGFNGLSGLFRFRRDGRNERALSILSVGQGSFSVVDPAPRSFSAQVSSLAGG